MDIVDLALRLGLALAIGFLVGLERGWRERGEEEWQHAAGLRTFSLIGLLGGIFGALSQGGDQLLLAAGLVTLAGGLGAFMWRESQHHNDSSATSFVAGLLTFALGAFALLGDTRAAAGAGVAATLLLANKEALHGWLARLSWIELRSGLVLAAMTFIALPLLPHRTVDPWNAVNPHELWLMTILIAAVSFAGYAAVKIAGAQRGLMLTATLGGLFASTAVTISLARLARHNGGRARLLSAGVLSAGTVMLLRVLVVISLINLSLAQTLAQPLLAAAAAMAVLTAILIWSDRKQGKSTGHDFDLSNPFDLSEVLRFGALLAIVMLAVALVRQYYGEPALLGLAALSGLLDVDALTISVARLGQVSPVAAQAILVTVAVNSFAKCVYAWLVGGFRIGLLTLFGTAISFGTGAAIYFEIPFG